MELQSGDIIETSSTGPIPFATHYAVYFLHDGIPFVAHNPFPGSITIEPYSTFISGRTFKRIAGHSALSDLEIYDKAVMLQKTRKWNLFTFSCEDFVREFCNCNLGIDQRVYGLTGIFVLLLLLFFGIKYIIKKIKS